MRASGGDSSRSRPACASANSARAILSIVADAAKAPARLPRSANAARRDCPGYRRPARRSSAVSVGAAGAAGTGVGVETGDGVTAAPPVAAANDQMFPAPFADDIARPNRFFPWPRRRIRRAEIDMAANAAAADARL